MKKLITKLTLSISLAWVSLVFVGCGGKTDKADNAKTEQTSSNEGENSGENNPDSSVREIVTGATSVTAPVGWAVIESPEFKCNVAWPDSRKLKKNCTAELDGGEFVFSFGAAERPGRQQENVTVEAVANMTEMQMRFGDELLSESTEEDGTFIRDFAFGDEERTVFGRIFVRKTDLWLISAEFPSGKEQDPRIKYFFEKFKPLK